MNQFKNLSAKLCVLCFLVFSLTGCSETQESSEQGLTEYQGTWTSGCVGSEITDIAINGDAIRIQYREYVNGGFCKESDFIEARYFSGEAIQNQKVTLSNGITATQALFRPTATSRNASNQETANLQLLMSIENKDLILYSNQAATDFESFYEN